MTEVFTAKTVDEAKALAAKKFGKKIAEIKFEVIEEGKKGFLGLGQVDAKVKATYIPPIVKAPKPETAAETPAPEETAPVAEEAPAPAESAPEAPVEEVVTAAEETAPVAEESAPAAAESTPAPAEEPEKTETPAAETAPKAEKPAKAASAEEEDLLSLDDYTLIEDESLIHAKVKIARDYITSILNAMDIEVSYTVYQNETGAIITIESNNNGTIIGRRGETLDSIQYLCSIIANKGDKDYFRITIDCLGYRSKRRETLQQLAAKVAKSVAKTGRSQQLEPMNPYERRVIHSAISEIEGITSRSVGEEPYRKIIISSTNPKPSRGRGNGRNGGRRDDRRGGGRGRGERRGRNENFEPKSIDVSTSFEKEYKKPKPEDSMEGGLYGKIEF